MTDLSVLPNDEFAKNSIDFNATDKSLFLSFLRTIQAKRKPSNANEASNDWDSEFPDVLAIGAKAHEIHSSLTAVHVLGGDRVRQNTSSNETGY